MTFAGYFRGAATVAGLCMGTTALADVTAGQVWGDFKSYLQGFGYEITADETQTGDGLTVSNVTMVMEMPEGAGTARVTVPELSFSETGDGSVEMTMPNMSTTTYNVDVEGEGDSSGEIDVVQNDFVMLVSGSPGDMVYNYSATDMQMAFKNLMVDGKPVDVAVARVEMRNLEGQSNSKVTDLRRTEQTMRAGSMGYDIDMADPEGGSGRLVMKGAVSAIEFAGTATTPTEAVDTNDMNAMLESGFGVEGNFTHSGSTTEFSFDEDASAVSGTVVSKSGSLGVRMDAGQLGYTVGSNDVTLNVTTSDLPFPVEMAMAESQFKFEMPVTPSEDPQDFALAIKLGDFVMSDMIWSMFDPAGQLPRDPATIAVDLTGTARLDAPIMDPEAMESAEAPCELRTLTIGDLVLRLAGAELTGAGDFTFDNSDTSTFDGMPRPEGALNLKLVGGNTLLDTLVAMGFVPQEQATGVRMMMGLFAVPGEGEDTLTSRIEVNEQGHVLANGQRLR